MTKDTKQQVADAVASFKSVFLSINDEIEQGLMGAGGAIEAQAKKNWKGSDAESVKGEFPRVQTGLLRGSITHMLNRDMMGASVAIGTNVAYAKDVEMGTSKAWPHPFLTPALNQVKPNIAKYIERAVKKAVEAGRYGKR